MSNIVTLDRDVPGVGAAGQAIDLSSGRYSLALLPTDVHSAEEITTYLAGYKQFAYRADEMSAPIMVDKTVFKYRNFDSANTFDQVTPTTSSSAAPLQIDPDSTLTSGETIPRALATFIPNETFANAGSLYKPSMRASQNLWNKLMLYREVEVVRTLMGTSTNWDSTVRTAASDSWDVVAGNPMVDIDAALNASYQPVESIHMNRKVFGAMVRNDYFKDWLAAMTGDRGLVDSKIPSNGHDFKIPGYPVFKIHDAKRTASAGGQEYILNDVVVLVTKPMSAPVDGTEIASSYTFRFNGVANTGISFREFEVPEQGPTGGRLVVVSHQEKAILTSNVSGGIITNVHS
jgi:hypothetical protein